LYAYPEDSGVYTCRAVNTFGDCSISCSLHVDAKAGLILDTFDQYRLAHLKKLENKSHPRRPEYEPQLDKPKFTTPLKSVINAVELGHVHLECRLEPINDSNLVVEWYVNGSAIKTGHRFKTIHDFGYVALDILYAYAEDTGTYSCKAINQMGEAVNSCSVKVVGN
jgi:titin